MSALAAATWLASASLWIQPPRANPIADAMRWGELVDRYLRGDGGEAVREVIAWSPGVLSDVVEGIEDAGSLGSFDIPQIRAARSSLPAAVMLHTEAALLLNWRDDSEGAAVHWDLARRLADLPVSKDQDGFFRAWYRAVGIFFLTSYGVDTAILLLDRGFLRYPDEPLLVLALGQAFEARGTFRNGRVPSLKPGLGADAKKDLATAEGLLRGLLKADPALWEARLRLGRCLWLEGRTDLALAELRRTGSSDGPAPVRYLAHLFMGDLHRRQSRVTEAREEFARALEVLPDGQTAALGLAEVLHSLGERREAAAALEAAIAERGTAPRKDPFHAYHFGDRDEDRRLLEAARDMARAPSAR